MVFFWQFSLVNGPLDYNTDVITDNQFNVCGLLVKVDHQFSCNVLRNDKIPQTGHKVMVFQKFFYTKLNTKVYFVELVPLLSRF